MELVSLCSFCYYIAEQFLKTFQIVQICRYRKRGESGKLCGVGCDLRRLAGVEGRWRVSERVGERVEGLKKPSENSPERRFH